jgi:hypothetical protein
MFSTSELIAQGVCLELIVKVEDSIRSNDRTRLILITSGDTIVAQKRVGLFCFSDTLKLIGTADIIVKSRGESFLFQSLFPGFLQIGDNPKWIVGFDEKPFAKENYPQIREWASVKLIEYFEVQPQTNEGAIMIYRRRKDGSYVAK